jgi:peptide/nickel transport system substrate-binding protein
MMVSMRLAFPLALLLVLPQAWRGVDSFHPAHQPDEKGVRPALPAPAWGGRATIHLESLPRTLNYALDTAAVTRRILFELNETLLTEDWETLELVPNLCRSFEVESPTEFVFHLRPGIVWHDGIPFDAHDVVFSALLYRNPKINCDAKRAQYKRIVEISAPDPLTVRVRYDQPYFRALASVGDMPILPAHLYELRRADQPDWKPSDDEAAEYVNKNPHNRDWVGLGPYKLERWDGDRLVAKRFEKYFDPERGGYLDELDWLYVKDDSAAFQALLNGEIDLFGRLSTEDFFGSATGSELFQSRFVKAWAPSGAYGFVAWNLRRPKLQDVRLRRALALAFDFEAFKKSCYRGLANQVTGHGVPESEFYDRELAALAFDPARAKELLSEAGWSDHDGDGYADKDGEALAIEMLSNSGNAVSESMIVAMQSDWSRVGVKLVPLLLDGNTARQRVTERQFDGFMSGWALPSESDPEATFHSKNAAVAGSQNLPGLADPEVDRLIEKGQRELDRAARAKIWRELQRRLYELQPYLWGFSPPRKFAYSQKLRGVEFVRPDPNYVARRWYWPSGTPGTRAKP